MADDFDLLIETEAGSPRATLRLRDSGGNQIAARTVDFSTLPLSEVQGLVDLRENVQRFAVRPGEVGRTAAEMVADTGVFLAREVLGQPIFDALAKDEDGRWLVHNRSLRVQLPKALDAQNHLAAALGRVPWEIARESREAPTLAENALVVRAVNGDDPGTRKSLQLRPNEALRVLFVFAQAKGSAQLNERRERRELEALFRRRIYPGRRIEADFVSHGVTRQELQEKIKARRGFHVIHWSGHGHRNLLEIANADGSRDLMSGEDLVDLVRRAGGFVPQVFFLSACHSGDILSIQDWKSFQAAVAGREMGAKEGDRDLTHTLEQRPGFTGTAHALLAAGVPSVVAMRYSVSDAYARDLAEAFYPGILADQNPKSVAEALNQARNALLPQGGRDRYSACDHATPVLYGVTDPGLPTVGLKGRSEYASPRDPRIGSPIAELDSAAHPSFVGRTWELVGLRRALFRPGVEPDAETRAVAVIQGIGGMGKTALAAEAIGLWRSQFQWVLQFQAKPNPLPFDATMREIHTVLYGKVGAYHDYVQEYPDEAIWVEATETFRGEPRLGAMRRNLIRAMRAEAILLVLDNYEGNLETGPVGGTNAVSGEARWRCQDPAWDALLTRLAQELTDSASRVLITSRYPLVALASGAFHLVRLGPLPAGEAALYLQNHKDLERLVSSNALADNNLAYRILSASRFHPLLMDRLARLLSGGEPMRGQLNAALTAMESSDGYRRLPELFTAGGAAERASEAEARYLVDALHDSIDLLLQQAGPDGRRLLWIIALANDPEALGLVRVVWEGKTVEDEQTEQFEHFRGMLERWDELPAELRQQIEATLPAERRREILAAPRPAASDRVAAPNMEPLLRNLVSVGLVTEERDEPDDENPNLTCHELVREHIVLWIENHAGERQEHTDASVRLAYAGYLERSFRGLLHQNMDAALEAGRRALVYCVQAENWDRLGGFASRLVILTSDPEKLRAILPYIARAAQATSGDRARWSRLTYFADGLRKANQSEASLTYYHQAAEAAEAAGQWTDVAWITTNWAVALYDAGQYAAALERQLASAEANRKAGRPPVYAIGRELEAYRIAIMQGHVKEVLPEVDNRIHQIQRWWNKCQAGESVPEAPDREYLGRILTGALDIAREAHYALQDWDSALLRIDDIIIVLRTLRRSEIDIAGARLNRASVLIELIPPQFAEAQREMEDCLRLFEGDILNSARTLSSLADLFGRQEDPKRAVGLARQALAKFNQLSSPANRASLHYNLAFYLERSGREINCMEAAQHRFADLVYSIAAGLGQSSQTSLNNYAIAYD